MTREQRERFEAEHTIDEMIVVKAVKIVNSQREKNKEDEKDKILMARLHKEYVESMKEKGLCEPTILKTVKVRQVLTGQ